MNSMNWEIAGRFIFSLIMPNGFMEGNENACELWTNLNFKKWTLQTEVTSK